MKLLQAGLVLKVLALGDSIDYVPKYKVKHFLGALKGLTLDSRLGFNPNLEG